MKNIFFLFLLSVTITSIGQDKDPNEIINRVEENYKKIKDYSADINISIDISLLKMPQKSAKVFFKQPDKFKIESDGFAMLPKEGINFSPSEFLKDDFSAIYIGVDTLDGKTFERIKIVPLSDTSKFVIMSLLVDTKKYFIRKIYSTTKQRGSIEIDFYYKDNAKLPLPGKVIFGFDTKDINLPADSNQEPLTNQKKNKRKKSLSGTIEINYNNYTVNQGIVDSIFIEK